MRTSIHLTTKDIMAITGKDYVTAWKYKTQIKNALKKTKQQPLTLQELATYNNVDVQEYAKVLGVVV